MRISRTGSSITLRKIMRAKLTLIMFLFFLRPLPDEAMEVMRIPWTAKSDKEIELWAASQGTSYRSLRYDDNGKKLLVVLIDSGSGVITEDIYVFFQEQTVWYLGVARFTNEEVRVEKTKSSLRFISIAGDLLVDQPLASLRRTPPPREKGAGAKGHKNVGP